MKDKRLLPAVIVLAVLFILVGSWLFFVNRSLRTVMDEPVAQEGEQGLIESLRNSAVMITVGEYHGSGFIVSISDREMLVATAAHLMEGFDQGIVSFSNGKVGFGTVSFFDADRDLCLLTFSSSGYAEDFPEGLNSVKLDRDRLSTITKGESVYIVDSSIKAGVNVVLATAADTDYYVPDFNLNMLYLYVDATEGMSGSGVFDSEGYLLGLLVGGSEASEAVCVKVSDIWSILEN